MALSGINYQDASRLLMFTIVLSKTTDTIWDGSWINPL